jgi:NAD(P)-dependent dehydrogenase (short-subunit alcohol dehydrogenase family)
MTTTKTWLITGASKGLGLALAKTLLQAGYCVAATSRNKEALIQEVGPASGSFLPLAVDLTSEASVQQGVQQAIDHFKTLDVIVNNAGYGIGGAVEELSMTEIRECFDVNLFGTIHVIQSVLPHLRRQRSGHIINIASIAGFAAATGWSVYGATKFAMVGLSEVLADDVRNLGIKVTVVAPGAFRTQFLTDESIVVAEKQISDYTDVHASHERYFDMSGTQAGDPEKAATALITLAESKNPPVRLFLGSDAYARATAKLDVIKTDLENWKDLTYSTNF